MAYVTLEDYEEYGGMDLEANTLNKLLKRANREIDMLIGGEDVYDSMTTQEQKHVKYAICSQVEFLALNGETASSVGGSWGSVSIGQYSESSGSRQGSSSGSSQRYADSVLDYLYRTRAMYRKVKLI